MKSRYAVILMLIMSAVVLSHIREAAAQGDLLPGTIFHRGLERSYYVHYPVRGLSSASLPLVLVLHGGGNTDIATFARRTGFNAIADREGFVVAYPLGIDGQWSDGRGETFQKPDGNTRIDDVGFISALIDLFVDRGRADRNRVYITGLSNGGMMTHRLGIELGAKVAAIAPVIANLPYNLVHARPTRPLPVLIMNGTDDPMMPWNGGPVLVFNREYGEVLSARQSAAYWAINAGLRLIPYRQVLEDVVPADNCRVVVNNHLKRGRSVEVTLYELRGGGHNFPGTNTLDLPRLLGTKCMDINAAEVIWAFFAKNKLS